MHDPHTGVKIYSGDADITPASPAALDIISEIGIEAGGDHVVYLGWNAIKLFCNFAPFQFGPSCCSPAVPIYNR